MVKKIQNAVNGAKRKYRAKEIKTAESITSKPPKTRLAINIGAAVFAMAFMLFLYYFSRDIKYIACGSIVTGCLAVFAMISYFLEKHQDKKYAEEKENIETGQRYRTQEWANGRTKYKTEVGFEQIKCDTMKGELKRQYRRRKTLLFILMWLMLSVGGVCAVFTTVFSGSLKNKIISVLGMVFFTVMLIESIDEFTGGIVRRFYKENQNDIARIESSFMKGKIVSHESSGLNIGAEYVVWWNEKSVNAVKVEQIENVSRKVVRVRLFEDYMYRGDEYKHYALFDVLSPSGSVEHFEIELNEYQVEMVIDEFRRHKYADRKAPVVIDSSEVKPEG